MSRESAVATGLSQGLPKSHGYIPSFTSDPTVPTGDAVVMTPAAYLSWMPQHDDPGTERFGEADGLWYQMGGPGYDLPVFGSNTYDDTWRALGILDDPVEETDSYQ